MVKKALFLVAACLLLLSGLTEEKKIASPKVDLDVRQESKVPILTQEDQQR
jgi:hypothetical protein